MITIDKDVPYSGRSRYPWKKMEPGNSFMIPLGGENGARGSGAHFCRAHRQDLRIAMRKENGGVRVWLVEKDR